MNGVLKNLLLKKKQFVYYTVHFISFLTAEKRLLANYALVLATLLEPLVQTWRVELIGTRWTSH